MSQLWLGISTLELYTLDGQGKERARELMTRLATYLFGILTIVSWSQCMQWTYIQDFNCQNKNKNKKLKYYIKIYIKEKNKNKPFDLPDRACG